MRPLAALLALPLAVAACDGAALAPPDDLPVRLASSPPPQGMTQPPPPRIVAQGDSIVAESIFGASGCYRESAVAGRVPSGVLITVTSRPTGDVCLAYIASAMYRVTVRPAPVGDYWVTYRFRYVNERGRETATYDVAKERVTVR